MASAKFGNSLGMAMCLASFAAAQNQPETCYGTGSIVGAVVGTLIVTLGLLVFSYFLYEIYWKNKKGEQSHNPKPLIVLGLVSGNHLVLMNDAENPLDQYAFDNPCFREATPIKQNLRDEKQNSKLEKAKWAGWPTIHSFGKEQKPEKITSMDDSYINDSRLKIVTLRSHDFTGLGFNICGNMRDGIFVKDILHRGPAFESGCINTGDRIHSVCISFRNMVFEDALTILSYASPYDVQVQVENDSYSRPSTLMRSKRESNAVNSSDRILHPKFSRSQSIYHLNEVGKTGSKKLAQQIGFMLEKNRINQSLNKSQDLISDLSAPKCSSPVSDERTNKNFIPKISPQIENKKSLKIGYHDSECESQQTKSMDSQNKLQKFGIKVLPININPKMGIQSVSGVKKPAKSPTTVENELNSAKEKPEKSKQGLCSSSMEEKFSGLDEPDTGKENMKGMLAKGFFTLKEKINQNTVGKKKKDEDDSVREEEVGGARLEEAVQEREENCPIPKLRSSVTCQIKAYEQNQKNQMHVPEEVTRAGDIARDNRKSVAETKKSKKNLEHEESHGSQILPASESDESSDRESLKDETKRTKRSKGKAPAPPKQIITSKDINEIKKESELIKDEANIFEPEAKTIPLKEDEDETEKSSRPSYDSDSDSEPATDPKIKSNTKIELNATQITVHQNPSVDVNDDDMEPNRKAASLGDLSKLDSEQPLSIVLERAVSLDLTEGTSQCGKKRKAPLPPSEEFPGVFDDLNYRKEPRLEGLNTFQRRLKKSSDFGTLEDALCDGPLEIEVNKHSPLNMTETHSYNIQEFSSWLAECRRPKATDDEIKMAEGKPTVSATSTSLININAPDHVNKEKEVDDAYEYQRGNVSFSVNGKNFPEFEINSPSENINFPRSNSRTVLVISQPNSLEPVVLEKPSVSDASNDTSNRKNESEKKSGTSDDDIKPPKLPTSPVPMSNTLSTPLSSTLTYITEIKVSTSDQDFKKNMLKSELELPPLNSVSERIQKFDPSKAFDSTAAKNHINESSKIPIRAMKSETGQKILATIQSLAKESSPTKTPEVEYAKKMAFILSNSQKNEINIRKNEAIENNIFQPPISGLYVQTSPPKPSKDYSPTRKVPPVVPPRKTETSLTTKSTLTVELPTPLCESQDRNVITFSPSHTEEESGTPTWTTFTIKEHGDINGRKENAGSVKKSTGKVMSETEESKEDV